MKGANLDEIYEKKNCRNSGGSRYGSDEYGEWYVRADGWRSKCNH